MADDKAKEAINLYLDYPRPAEADSAETFAWMEGLDALVIDPCRCTPQRFEAMPVPTAVILGGEPGDNPHWREIGGHWVHDQGIEACARLRDLYPELGWVPKLNLFRAKVSYRFSGPAVGEGFSFYIPDTSAIHEWRVDGGELALAAALARAEELGFTAIWLCSPEAQRRARGLELDLLDRTGGCPMDIWLSGGACDARHLTNLAKVGGSRTVVVDESLVRQSSVQELRAALAHQAPAIEAVPVTFGLRAAGPGAP